MDEVSRGLDEMALNSRDNNSILRNREVGSVTTEACGCAEVLARNDSIGCRPTPLHRCKGRHHLPIIGEEMQGDQLPQRKPDDAQPPEGFFPKKSVDSITLEKKTSIPSEKSEEGIPSEDDTGLQTENLEEVTSGKRNEDEQRLEPSLTEDTELEVKRSEETTKGDKSD